MALDDLDLEFEDEEEAKKKKSDAVQQDVDLEFHVQDTTTRPRPMRPGGPVATASPAKTPAPGAAGAQVRQISEARPQASASPTAGAIKRPATTPPVSGANALNPRSQSAPVVEDDGLDMASEEIVQLRERARKAEFDAEVKIQLAEFKTELLSELLSDIKLMDHQINQLLVRIHAKHPDMKQEVLMIKKILADFSAKKRK
jgi:hypothetical protein